MRNWLFLLSGIGTSLLIVAAFIYNQNASLRLDQDPSHDSAQHSSEPSTTPSLDPTASPNGAPNGAGVGVNDANSDLNTHPQTPAPPQAHGSPTSNSAPDFNPDAAGLSKATVTMNTTAGIIKFKFYSKDAPKTTHRIAELIQSGFYNGLAFHRVVPGFVVQGGDPVGNGTGGSGQKIDAEFNSRRHIEGAVAMARAGDPNSADSQFYISLGTLPHLDHNYTVFGQVTEGMEVAKKLKVGDKMTTVSLQ